MEKREVLLVEDNPVDESLILRALDQNKIANQVVVVHDGAAALDYLLCQGDYAGNRQNPLPAVVLLDLKLPKVDGLEVLRRLRAHERTKHLPVVILTSSKEQQDLIDGYSLGANSYVQKPIEFGEFARAVQNLGLFWFIINEPPPRI